MQLTKVQNDIGLSLAEINGQAANTKGSAG
jgi:hypothetical protein